MKRDRNLDYYEKVLEFERDNSVITSDFSILIKILFEFIVYLVFLIPNILILFYFMLIFNKNKMNRKFDEIVIYPFKILSKLQGWFFEAKFTAFLILLLIFVFMLEFVVLAPFMDNLKVHTSHLITGTNFYSTFTSIFLHANITHLLTNCLAFLIFGRQVEKNVKGKIILLFIGSGILSNVISNIIAHLMGESYYSLGASGAIAGIIMFAILLEPFALTSVFLLPIPIFLVGWFLIFLDVIGLFTESQTNHLAHLGGYLALLILFFFLEIKYRNKIMKGFWLNLSIIGVFVIFGWFFGFSEIVILFNQVFGFLGFF